MNITSINYSNTKQQSSVSKTNQVNPAFGCHLTTGSRLRSLNSKYQRKQGYEIRRQIIRNMESFQKKAINISGLYTELDGIKDKSGKISNGVYKICKNLIAKGEDYAGIMEYLGNFKKQDGHYDEIMVKKANKLPEESYKHIPNIIEKTKDLPADMQQEIFQLFNLYDNVHNSFMARLGRYIKQSRYNEPHAKFSKKTAMYDSDLMFKCITDNTGKYNTTLIRAMRALINHLDVGSNHDYNNIYRLSENMSDITHFAKCYSAKDSSRYKLLSKILKSEDLSIEQVGILKVNPRDAEIVLNNWRKKLGLHT